ncbi:uncharacterized protein TEOVI_000862100 [Trypanosoma equiperdum]|uniref:Transmembrane protein n=2 Tax=Trypanozoon TaxID=39700 RepID=Q57W00_TRYB2|nr:hypothetical protein, conserved [Trypanosoma brucei brucei TREU927]AAX70219.1 hypothetical protein, conserved [Trypanosoma brucei]AAZ13200.1 hypothetical protein, conserved [Trypanosoma brucei brucei TREU927]SCU65231.1 hypothetical protein, conserved [Trypanosoma equiperdum]
MLYDVVELLANYVQYINLTVLIAPSVFPPAYSSFLRFVGRAMNAISHGGGVAVTVNGTSKHNNTTRMFEGSTLNLPKWMPPDLRRVFALTNIVAPLSLVVLFAPVLGPPQFIAFAYALCTAVFFLAGCTLLLHAQHSLEVLESGSALLKLVRAIPSDTKVAIAAASAVSVGLLAAVGLTLRLIWGKRRQAQLLEQLRHLEQAPHSVEERVAESLMNIAASHNGCVWRDGEGGMERPVEEREREETRLRCAKAELAYQEMMQRRHGETHAFSLWWALLKLLVLLGSGTAAAFLLRKSLWESTESLFCSPLIYFPVSMLLLTTFFLALSLSVGLSEGGRRWLFDAKLWFRHLFLYTLLLLVSFLYAPLIRSAIGLIPCRDVVDNNAPVACGADNKSTSVLEVDTSKWSTTEARKLMVGSNVSCDSVNFFLYASALLTSTTYATFFILLYGLVTRQALLALEHYPLEDSGSCSARSAEVVPAIGGNTAEAFHHSGNFFGRKWEPARGTVPREGVSQSGRERMRHKNYYGRVHSSQNEVHFLYAPYTFSWRYFKLVVLAQKTAVVIFSAVMQEDDGLASPWTGFIASVILHLGMLVILVVCRPYSGPVEFALSLALQLMLVVLAAMGLVSSFKPAVVSRSLWSFVASCFLLVPCGAILVGGLLASRRQCRLKHRKRTKRRQRGNQVCGFLWDFLTCGLRPKPKHSGSHWFLHHNQEPRSYQIFVPALYFSLLKTELSANAGPLGAATSDRLRRVGSNHLHLRHNRVGDGFNSRAASPSPPAVDHSVPPANSYSTCGSPSPSAPSARPVVTSTSRSRERWAHVRSALFSGRLRSCSPAKTLFSIRQTPVTSSTWREETSEHGGVTTPQTLEPTLSISASSSPLAEEHQLCQRAMTVLFSTVGGACRWGASPCVDVQKSNTRRRLSSVAVYERGSCPYQLISRRNPWASLEGRHCEAFLERAQAVAARQRLIDFYQNQRVHMLRKQRAVDCYINAQAAQMVRWLLIFLGISAAAAAALFLRGVLQVGERHVVVGVLPNCSA